MRASRVHEDAVTREPYTRPRPGAVPTDRYAARVRTADGVVLADVDAGELVEGDESRGVRPDAVPAVVQRASKTKTRAKPKRDAATYQTAQAGARAIVDGNESFFGPAIEADPADHVRDWLAGVEVRAGRHATRRVLDTPTGRRLLAGVSGARRGLAGAVAVLAWVLGRNASRRWASVDWDLVRGFEDALRAGTEDGLPPVVYPSHGGASVTGSEIADLEEHSPRRAREVTERANADRLRAEVEELREAFARARCLRGEARRMVARRLRYLERTADDPTLVSRLCETRGSLGRLCDYPTLSVEIAELRRACSSVPVASEDVDLPWENPGLRMRPLKRGPFGLADGLELVDLLGWLDELELVDGRVIRWDAAPPSAYWHPQAKAFLAFDGLSQPRPTRERTGAAGGRAVETFARWTGRPARRRGTLHVEVPIRWHRIGSCARLDYTSRKWGRRQAYTHETTTAPIVYRVGGARAPWVWVVCGGGFTLTTRGLVG